MATYHSVKRLFFTLFLVVNTYLSSTDAELKCASRPKVKIPQGTLLGITRITHKNRTISGFLGIPFAKPPTGNLRFASPVAASGWQGTRHANTDSNMCPQISGNGIKGDEDCLYINVYTPQLPRNKKSSLLPVMVFIHSGGFEVESQISTTLGPEYLLDKDVVLAVPNYRLGPLGFLSTGDEIASGNWGLKDQVLALKWVQDNIKYFGGDPGQVTLFGLSAGAACVHLLTLSDSTIGLFHRYITQSGSALAPWVHQSRTAYSSRAFELGKYVGCSKNKSNSLIDCLRKVNVSNILATRTEFSMPESPLQGAVWSPTDELNVKGAVLTDSPTNLFTKGKIRDLPWITGVVKDEGLLATRAFYENNELLPYFMENIDFILPKILNSMYQSDSGTVLTSALKSFYLNKDLQTTKTSILLSELTLLVGDTLFIYPAYNALKQQHALAKNPQYFYIFNYQGTYSQNNILTNSTEHYGVEHGDDIVYLFRSGSFFANRSKAMSQKDLQMVDTMVELWTSFAINGKPTSSALKGTMSWEPYSSEDNYLRIGNGSDVAVEVEYSFLKARMQFWDGLNTIEMKNEMDNHNEAM